MNILIKLLVTIVISAIVSQIAFAKQLEGEALRTNVIKRLPKLNHTKLQALMQRVVKKAPKGYYQCLCHSYSTMGNGIGYSPKRDKHCDNTDPCKGGNWGCTSYPLPSDSKVIERCIKSAKYDDNSTIIDAITGAIEDLHLEQKEENSSTALKFDKLANKEKLKKELEACKKRYLIKTEMPKSMLQVNGLEYMGNNGWPLLEIPDFIEKELTKDINKANKIISGNLVKKENVLGKKVKNSLLYEMGKSVAANKSSYETISNVALATVKYDSYRNKIKFNNKKKEYKTAYSDWKKDQKNQVKKARYKALLEQGRELKKEHNKYKKHIQYLTTFKKAVNVGFVVNKLDGIYGNALSKDPRKNADALMESAKWANEYFKAYQKNNYDLNDFSKIAKLNDSEFNTYLEGAKELKDASFVINNTIKAGEVALKVYDEYQNYKKFKNRAIELYNNGSYSEAQRNMLMAFDGMSYFADKASGYMPPGMNDMVKFYAEAMKTPGKIDSMMREIVDRPDVYANIKGTQSWATPMKEYNSKYSNSLERKNYLFRKARLHVYKMDKPDKGIGPYVVMARNDKPPLYINEKLYKDIQEFAYYYPIAHKKRLSDRELYEKIQYIGDKGKLDLRTIKKKAELEMKDAARKKEIADMFGKKTVTSDEISQWYSFKNLMFESLPLQCILDSKTQKNLFGKYRDSKNSEQVKKFLLDYGNRLKDIKDK